MAPCVQRRIITNYWQNTKPSHAQDKFAAQLGCWQDRWQPLLASPRYSQAHRRGWPIWECGKYFTRQSAQWCPRLAMPLPPEKFHSWSVVPAQQKVHPTSKYVGAPWGRAQSPPFADAHPQPINFSVHTKGGISHIIGHAQAQAPCHCPIRFSAFSPFSTFPTNCTCPLWACIKPLKVLSNVVWPVPLAPITATNSPSFTYKFTLRSACILL